MIEIAYQLTTARRRSTRVPPPELRCFHDGVDPQDEIPHAVRNWHG
jgi:hypothetical protein